jgi:hypothetical protein
MRQRDLRRLQFGWASFFLVDAATRCANPIVLADFYDREFNPDGSHAVITFCDGGDSVVNYFNFVAQ